MVQWDQMLQCQNTIELLIWIKDMNLRNIKRDEIINIYNMNHNKG